MDINEYRERLKEAGFRAIPGRGNTVWVSHERFSMLRLPAFAVEVPSRDEIKSVFRLSRAAMLSFCVRPTHSLPANSQQYLCQDAEYFLEKLAKGVRYDIRRGLSEFELKFLDQSDILSKGKEAYYDTLARTGLSASHRESFEHVFGGSRRDRRYLGALKRNRLAAFLLVTEVEDWVSIGGYSANEFLPLRPNNALVYHAVHYYLVEKKFRVVDYGLSSIQADSKAEGLHKFKLKMGFEPVPVHRAFVVNPLLKPLVNRISLRFAQGMLRVSPKNPVLKKAEGALRLALQGRN
ncbi:MAG TPA: hypothetical protein VE994_15620 [Terriglobales bacterium]|nr:hypothetical protein [Terriglobales bacterium]